MKLTKEFLNKEEAHRFRAYLRKNWFVHRGAGLGKAFFTRTGIARSTAQNWFDGFTKIERRHVLRVAVSADPVVLGVLDWKDDLTAALCHALSVTHSDDEEARKYFTVSFITFFVRWLQGKKKLDVILSMETSPLALAMLSVPSKNLELRFVGSSRGVAWRAEISGKNSVEGIVDHSFGEKFINFLRGRL